MGRIEMICMVVGCLLVSGCGVADSDGDGSPDTQDCAPDSAAVHPGAEEHCNGVDDDCDGMIDEDATDAQAWYLDVDGDGYGDGASSTLACEAPDNFVSRGDDCDDLDISVHPEAEERCNGTDDDCDGATDEDAVDASSWFLDEDGDSYGDDDSAELSCSPPPDAADRGGDCDDEDSAVHPAASERCDGVDNDCDEEIDEDDAIDADTWYVDEDGDGYGLETSSVVACTPPTSHSALAGDCDDVDPAINPGADEHCNGTDDDCDGRVDDEDPDVLDASSWDADLDGDGFGDTSSQTVACEQPPSTVLSGGDADCDDSDGAINPAALEVCDAVDNDCDGDIDPSTAADASTWYEDDDGDGYGDSARDLLACEQPTGTSPTAGDCDDRDAGVNPAATERCDAGDVDEDCDGLADDDDPDVAAGGMSLWYVDRDGDGHGDSADAGISACDDPSAGTSAYASGATDCDDADSAINPDAIERCDSVDDDCDGLVDEEDPDVADATTWFLDADGDGYGDATISTLSCASLSGYVTGAYATDCDDLDATINPGVLETCDGVDEDCDGLVDDDDPDVTDVLLLYVDADEDGYGDPATTAWACDVGDGLVASADDCDDSDATINPGATEVCDAADVDEDCDGLADDDDADVDPSSQNTVFIDTDGDGYEGSSTLACDGVLTATDCDESDPAVNPAGTETCDGRDEDCDGDVDEGLTGGLFWYSDADGDGYGDASSSIEACAQPSGYIADGSDCDDGDGDIHPDATELCWDGLDRDCDGDAEDDDQCAPIGTIDAPTTDVRVLQGTASQYLGKSLAGGDADGDGSDDMFLGATGYDSSAGRVYGYAGPITAGSGGTLTSSEAAWTLTGDNSGDLLGSAMVAGDFDGDGLEDLVVSALGEDSAAASAGAVYLVGASSLASGAAISTSADAMWTGVYEDEGLGTSLAVGDLCGDSGLDLLVGAPGGDRWGATEAGMAYIIDNSQVFDGGSIEDADVVLVGEQLDDEAGVAVAVIGDMDADGYDELAIGAPGSDHGGTDAGKIWILEGPLSGRVELAVTPTVILGDVGDELGSAISGAGDVDGDGYSDLLLGTPEDGNEGSAWLILGSIHPGYHDSSTRHALLVGDSRGDDAGTTVAGAGDMDQDGYADILVGAPGHDGGGSGAGAVHLIYGPVSAGSVDLSTADAVIQGTSSGYGLGSALLGWLDLDGDGYDDMITGGYAADLWGISNTGYALALLGGPRVEVPYEPAVVDPSDDADGDGWSEDDGDCDDSRAAASPDGTEICESLVDEDCDGWDAPCAASGVSVFDETSWSVWEGQETVNVDAAAMDILGDVNGDGWTDFGVGLCVMFGPAAPGYRSPSVRDICFTAEDTNDFAGEAVVGLGDFDGDGIDDFAIGAQGNDDAATNAGKVYLILGDEDLTDGALADADITITGLYYSDWVGDVIAGLGDVDGDGLQDLGIGGTSVDDEVGGGAWVFFGGRAPGAYDLNDADIHIPAPYLSSQAGWRIEAAGDVDADGSDDILLTSRQDSDAGYLAGKVHLLYGPLAAGELDLSDALPWFTGLPLVSGSGGSYLGEALGGEGDVNGDGYGDIILSSIRDERGGSDAGAAFLFYGPVAPFARSAEYADVIFYGERSGDLLGSSVCLASDLDNDGYDDVAIGAREPQSSDYSYDAGKVYVFYGPISPGEYEVTHADAILEGTNQVQLGAGLACGEDLDQDGFEDLLMGGDNDSSIPDYDAAVALLRGGLRTGTYTEPALFDSGADVDGDGWTTDDGDCDDTDATVSPDATEVCNSGVDEDCDGHDQICFDASGTVDIEDWRMLSIEGEYARREYGASVTTIEDLDGDGQDELLIGEVHGYGASSGLGTVHLFWGAPPRGDFASTEDALLGAETGTHGAGGALADAGDLDGDGIHDLLIGATGTTNGTAYLLWGDNDFDGDYSLGLADVVIHGSGVGDELGHDLDAAGDVDGDGLDDIVIGAQLNDDAGSDAGAVYVFHGPLSPSTLWAYDADLVLQGESSGDRAGTCAGVGDSDGDGYDDLWIGAPYQGSGGSEMGRAYLWLGDSSVGTYSLNSADSIFTGTSRFSGRHIAGPGDTDGDGRDELLIGATYDSTTGSEAGAVYWYAGAPATGHFGPADADATFLGEAAGDHAGEGLGGADLDADGYPELLIGAPDEDSASSHKGALYIIWGGSGVSGTTPLGSAPVKVRGGHVEYLGEVIGHAGDIDGDGYDDLPLGAPTADMMWVLPGGER